MNTTPEDALKAILPIINRAPMNQAEAMGVQQCVAIINAAIKELAELKSAPPKPE
jgi:hypothetical protein